MRQYRKRIESLILLITFVGAVLYLWNFALHAYIGEIVALAIVAMVCIAIMLHAKKRTEGS